MKKILLFACSALMAVGIRAQQHLDFMGYPMQGSITDFTEAIRQRFPLQKKVGGDYYYIFRGSVYGHDSYFKVEYTRKSRTVYKITVTPSCATTAMPLRSRAAIAGIVQAVPFSCIRPRATTLF